MALQLVNNAHVQELEHKKEGQWVVTPT